MGGVEGGGGLALVPASIDVYTHLFHDVLVYIRVHIMDHKESIHALIRIPQAK
jgi:hypothetical protein